MVATGGAVDLAPIRNSLGEVVPTVADDQGIVRAAAPNGRLVVAPGQTIASAWGNTTYDQTLQTFASAADRTNQWPAPNEGAQSWLVDTRTPWIYRNGVWRAMPLGFVGQATGPATTTTFTANATIASLVVAMVAGRRYRFTGYGTGSITTATVIVRVGAFDPASGSAWIWYDAAARPSSTVGAQVGGTGVGYYTAPTTGNGTFLITYSGGSGWTVQANACVLTVEDVGN